MKTLTIPETKYSITVPASHIIRIEASSNYSRIYFADGNTLLVAKVLKVFQQSLPPDIFIRVHKSHLINKLFYFRIYCQTPYL